MKHFIPFLLLTGLSAGIAFSAPPKKLAMKWPPSSKSNYVSVDKFTTDPSLEVTIWAQSPQFYNPTNMSIDPEGRIWVTEGVNYREKLGIRRNAGDRIMVLIDTDKDGQADQSKVFLQDPYLESPLGISVFDNQIVISQPPDIVVYTDVNRDLKFDPKVDKKEVLLTGFNGRQHDHSLHSVTAGPDGKWYFNSGNCGAIFTDNSGKTFRMNTNYRGGASEKYFYTPTHELNGAKSDDGFVWTSGFSVRMDPDGTDAEIIGHGYRNSYEQVVNSLGDMYQSDNDDYSSCRNSYVLEFGSAGYYSLDGQHKWQADKRPGQAIPRAHWRQDDPGLLMRVMFMVPGVPRV
jgi:putative membrane-bound dehydrogenase-like protein